MYWYYREVSFMRGCPFLRGFQNVSVQWTCLIVYSEHLISDLTGEVVSYKCEKQYCAITIGNDQKMVFIERWSLGVSINTVHNTIHTDVWSL